MQRWHGVLAALTLLGMSAACEEADAEVDCREVCAAYKACVDTSYDADACIDRCTEAADDDEAFRERVDDCEDCIEDSECTEQFACAEQCEDIVP
jgi:hypothetical protein